MKRPRALSGGMRQRVAIARALAVAPDLLLMDEPFTSLDIGLRTDLQNLVRTIVDERKLAAILVTHDPIEAVMLADRIIVLGGRPAKKLADVPLSPRPANAAEAYAAAADLIAAPRSGRGIYVIAHGRGEKKQKAGVERHDDRPRQPCKMPQPAHRNLPEKPDPGQHRHGAKPEGEHAQGTRERIGRSRGGCERRIDETAGDEAEKQASP